MRLSSSHFLVLGRPRSRTAWVANLMTVPPVSHCLHEGLVDVRASLPGLRKHMGNLPSRIVGNADTGLIHYLDEIFETFPGARLVLMTNNDASWNRWCYEKRVPPQVKAKVDMDYLKAQNLLKGLAHFVDCKSVTADESVARDLWQYCVPHNQHPFDSQRWRFLKDLNVQVIKESLVNRLRGSGLSPQSLSGILPK